MAELPGKRKRQGPWVLCTGLKFDEVIRQTFAAYDAKSVRGLVVDDKGVIQMDSAIEGLSEKLIFNNDEQIQEEFHDPDFTAAVLEHLRGIKGFFTGQEEVRVVEMKEGIYSYASIAPIEGTNWTVITLYNASSLFSAAKMLPVFGVMVCMFVVYAIAMIVMNRKLIVKPFNRLIESLREVEADSSVALYGLERADEFGDLARTVSSMKDRLDANHAILKAESERAEQASLAKSAFLANMSHENMIIKTSKARIVYYSFIINA